MDTERTDITELRKIGWACWDPIGLLDRDGSPPDGAVDEYDSYLKQTAWMLLNGADSAAAVAYLVNIAAEHMGLGHGDVAAATKTVGEIQRYLSNRGSRT